MKIVKATIKDADQILKLQLVAYESEAKLNDDFNIPPLTQSLDELKKVFEHKTILNVVEDGRLLASGQANFNSGTCYIGRMAVWPELQGKGIGSKLLSALESTFANTSHVELFTGENSISNLAMYKRRGYIECKREKLGKTTVVYLSRVVKIN
jgi:ribosomal protein S18 acetylase RimI-like enzyme